MSYTPNSAFAVLGTGVSTFDGFFHMAGYGVAANAKTLGDGAITTATNVLTSATAAFTAGDVGKRIVVCNAGGVTNGLHLHTTISGFTNSTTVTLTASASRTVSAICFTYGTDDTTAAQAAITAAAAVRGTVLLPPTPMLITATLTIPKGMTLRGSCAVGAGWGAVRVGGYGTLNGPTSPPFLGGSVVVVAVQNVDAFKTTAGIEPGFTVNIENVGILFAGLFNSTGNGIYLAAPASTIGKDNGACSSNWKNIYVFGHDGSHYAFISENPLCNTGDNIQSWGGGLVHLDGSATDTAITSTVYGNTLLSNIYGQGIGSGSATGGIRLNKVQLCSLIRPQFLNGNVSPLIASYAAAGWSAAPYRSDYSGGLGNYHVAPDYEQGASVFSAQDYLTAGGIVDGSNLANTVPSGVYPLQQNGNAVPYTNSEIFQPPIKTRTTRRSPVQVGIGTQSFQSETGRPIWSDALDWRYSDGAVAFIAAASAGAGVDPTTVGGYEDRWRAQDLALADGAAVASFTSTSTAAHVLAQATGANQPTFRTLLVNGKSALRFNGTSTYMQSTYVRNAPTTVFVVAKLPGFGYVGSPSGVTSGPPSNQNLYDGVTADARLNFSAPTPTGDGQPAAVYLASGGNFSFTDSGKAIPDQWGVFTGVFNGASSLIRWNGGTLTASGDVGAGNPGGFTLGTGRGLTSFLKGDVAEVLTYNVALSAATCLTVERFLGTYYALPVI